MPIVSQQGRRHKLAFQNNYLPLDSLIAPISSSREAPCHSIYPSLCFSLSSLGTDTNSFIGYNESASKSSRSCLRWASSRTFGVFTLHVFSGFLPSRLQKRQDQRTN